MKTLATRLQRQDINRVHVVDKEVYADLERLPRVARTTCLQHGVSDPKCRVQKLPVRTEFTLIVKFLGTKRGLCESYKILRLIDDKVGCHSPKAGRNVRGGFRCLHHDQSQMMCAALRVSAGHVTVQHRSGNQCLS